MREKTEDSVKLNRQLDRYLEKALEENKPVKIGWGQAGDERPKSGEIGVITHLPKGARVLCLGDLGECSGSMNRGGTFTLQGSAGSLFGSFQKDGKTIAENSVGDRAAYKMKGGEIVIKGSVGDDLGAAMSGGVIIVQGNAGNGAGTGMISGTIIVMGSVGINPGLGMKGGKLIIAGSCPPPDSNINMRSITNDELEEYAEILDPLAISLNSDALVLESSIVEKEIEKLPERYISEGFENISLNNSISSSLSDISILNHGIKLSKVGFEEGIDLPIPLIIEADSAKRWKGNFSKKQSALVTSNPRKNDLIRITENELVDSIDYVNDCAGVVLDLASLRGLNDAEIEGIIISISSRMDDSGLFLLEDSFERVDNLFRLVISFGLDGAIVDSMGLGGSRLPAILPIIVLKAKSMGIYEMNKSIILRVDKTVGAEDILISSASGFTAISAPSPEKEIDKFLKKISEEIRGWMRELGIDDLDKIGRSNLRADNYDTAAISGLRLIGYERPLPMWLELR